jgi:hypothetical protein
LAQKGGRRREALLAENRQSVLAEQAIDLFLDLDLDHNKEEHDVGDDGKATSCVGRKQ